MFIILHSLFSACKYISKKLPTQHSVLAVSGCLYMYLLMIRKRNTYIISIHCILIDHFNKNNNIVIINVVVIVSLVCLNDYAVVYLYTSIYLSTSTK
jgi:hypothetical protein